MAAGQAQDDYVPGEQWHLDHRGLCNLRVPLLWRCGLQLHAGWVHEFPDLLEHRHGVLQVGQGVPDILGVPRHRVHCDDHGPGAAGQDPLSQVGSSREEGMDGILWRLGPCDRRLGELHWHDDGYRCCCPHVRPRRGRHRLEGHDLHRGPERGLAHTPLEPVCLLRFAVRGAGLGVPELPHGCGREGRGHLLGRVLVHWCLPARELALVALPQMRVL
mmetsp:Transcript_24877/g.68319  ORF Transcript_24877/g.68319 Transcript_24877/m.68319 type:complete len:217 (-) Transcript_24877:586-1236(-)